MCGVSAGDQGRPKARSAALWVEEVCVHRRLCRRSFSSVGITTLGGPFRELGSFDGAPAGEALSQLDCIIPIGWRCATRISVVAAQMLPKLQSLAACAYNVCPVHMAVVPLGVGGGWGGGGW